jgi:hypothetical protein
MMFDKELQISSAQNVTVTTAVYSEDYVQLGAAQMITAGEPIALFVSAYGGPTTALTLTVELIADQDGAGTGAVVLGSSPATSIASATSTAPVQITVYGRAPYTVGSTDCLVARYTCAGASAAGNVIDAYIQPANGLQTALGT